jgi:hypothetical protein
VYKALFGMVSRDFKTAAQLFLDSLATFTTWVPRGGGGGMGGGHETFCMSVWMWEEEWGCDIRACHLGWGPVGGHLGAK